MTINDPKKRLQIFLCHSSSDKEVIHGLFQKLVDEGFDPWLDKEKLLGGQDWDYEIKKAMKTSDAVIVFLSNNSVSKAGYIQKEIKWAIDLAQEQPEGEIFLIPARIEDCNIPSQLKYLHSPELFQEKGYQKLIEALKIRAARLNRYLKDDLTKTYRNFLGEYFNQASPRLLLDKIESSRTKSKKILNLGFVGLAGAGKSSLIYTLAETNFNFLQFQEQSAYSMSISNGDIRFIDYYPDFLVAEEGSTSVKHIINETDLFFFVTSASTGRFRRDEILIFQNLAKSSVPVFILVTKIDTCGEEELKMLLKHIEEVTSRSAIPVSVVQGVNIDALRNFIAKAKIFYD